MRKANNNMIAPFSIQKSSPYLVRRNTTLSTSYINLLSSISKQAIYFSNINALPIITNNKPRTNLEYTIKSRNSIAPLLDFIYRVL